MGLRRLGPLESCDLWRVVLLMIFRLSKVVIQEMLCPKKYVSEEGFGPRKFNIIERLVVVLSCDSWKVSDSLEFVS